MRGYFGEINLKIVVNVKKSTYVKVTLRVLRFRPSHNYAFPERSIQTEEEGYRLSITQ
jgi:hypothetical protein